MERFKYYYKKEKDLISNLLKNYRSDIELNSFEELYKEVNSIDISASDRTYYITPLITSLLINIGINPLLHLKEVPSYYMQGVDITNVDIPDNITSIGEYAFYDSKVKNIKLSKNLFIIKGGAFFDCTELQSIIFPSSLEQIDQDAFFNCNKLKDIRYEGTVKQLDSNVIIETDGNAPLFENIITCKYGKVIAYINNWTDEITWNRVK